MAAVHAGTFHMRWDNGRTLGLVLGEDSFSVLPPEPNLLKLYMPITITYYEKNEWGDLDDDDIVMDNREALGYTDAIAGTLLREKQSENPGRGLMEYYGEDDGVGRKVQSYRFTAEVRDGRLWGVAECMVLGELTPEELELLKSEISGQASDGFGESYEQHPIYEADRELYVHLWNSDDWDILTEQERFAPKLADGLPELCFSTLKSTGELICIKRGESGYYPSDWSTSDKARNAELADDLNEQMGVTPAQRQAMEIGSMVGWAAPGADPAFCEEQMKVREQQTGGLTLG